MTRKKKVTKAADPKSAEEQRTSETDPLLSRAGTNENEEDAAKATENDKNAEAVASAPPASPTPSPPSPPVAPSPAAVPSPAAAPAADNTERTIEPNAGMALLGIWDDPTSAQLVGDQIPNGKPSHKIAIPKSLIGEIMAFVRAKENEKLTKVTEIAESPQLKRKADSQADNGVDGDDAITVARPSQRRRIDRELEPEPTPEPKSVSTDLARWRKVRAYNKAYKKDGSLALWDSSDDENISSALASNHRARLAAIPRAKRLGTMPSRNLYANGHDRGNIINESIEEESAQEEPAGVEAERSDSRSSREFQVERAFVPAAPGQSEIRHDAQETPRNRGWGLSSLMSIPRSVTRFVPGFGRREEPARRAQLPMGNEDAPVPADVQHTLTITSLPSTPEPQHRPAESFTQTEPRQENRMLDSNNLPTTENANQSAPRPRQTSTSTFKTRAQINVARHKKLKEDILAANAKVIDEEVTRKVNEEVERKVKEALEREKLREAEKAVPTGNRRKRIPSPDVIPNPPGCSYGMDINFFCYSSSDEENEEDTRDERPPPAKRARRSTELPLSPSPRTPLMVGDQNRARPYTGTVFQTSSGYSGGNLFARMDETNDARQNQSEQEQISPPTKSRTFSVDMAYEDDSEESSESDEDAVTEVINTPTRVGSQNKPGPSKVTSTPSAPANNSAPSKPSGPWTLPPPPRPNPSSATLPPNSGPTGTEALAKARSKAMKHAPKYPSSLRASSRLSSSTAASDVGDEHIDREDPEDQVEAEGQVTSSISNSHGVTGHTKVVSHTATESQMRGPEKIGVDVGNAVAHVPEDNLLTFEFPKGKTYAEAGIISPEVQDLLDKTWTKEDEDRAERAFEHEFAIWKANKAAATAQNIPV